MGWACISSSATASYGQLFCRPTSPSIYTVSWMPTFYLPVLTICLIYLSYLSALSICLLLAATSYRSVFFLLFSLLFSSLSSDVPGRTFPSLQHFGSFSSYRIGYLLAYFSDDIFSCFSICSRFSFFSHLSSFMFIVSWYLSIATCSKVLCQSVFHLLVPNFFSW